MGPNPQATPGDHAEVPSPPLVLPRGVGGGGHLVNTKLFRGVTVLS